MDFRDLQPRQQERLMDHLVEVLGMEDEAEVADVVRQIQAREVRMRAVFDLDAGGRRIPQSLTCEIYRTDPSGRETVLCAVDWRDLGIEVADVQRLATVADDEC